MSVDYGDARTGIAFCDANEILANAYTVIKERHREELVNKLLEIINKEKPGMVVIGLPRNMDGSYGFRCDECRELGNDLAKKIEIPVEYEDERLTTVIANSILSENNVRGKKRKNTVDAVSAVIILQDFIDKRKK